MIDKIASFSKIKNESVERRIQSSIDFNKILEDVSNASSLKVSSHAMERMRERNITLDTKDIENLSSAVKSIKEKGGKEALIFYNNVAFITSIKNNTIITAVDSSNLKNNIFTKIDSAIIL
ncbi:flagellar biosynthesis protein [Fervidicella metallireducens AeB]|uniref:Flagellar biosynthesis protein n=1 Tax=Fervidicella metallireducens AeB TaxID=1403537 RepID=A0A017RW02_9CLOT|nr:TIGR02530 family flagellar biosynthesis protein [Fervidicella metallireducens]EYE88801.1 flagellar biosynthesis protein [Fervidicella metallireducens AeB]